MKKIVFLIGVLAFLQGVTLCTPESSEKDYVITITTQYGDMVAILYDETPKHKENFIKLARAKYFDGTLFHRVIKDFMIQGGDPDSRTVKPGGHLGNGGPGYTIPAEINSRYFHEKGALSAARLEDKDNPTKASSGSQFYVVQGHKVMDYEIESMTIDRPKFSAGVRKMLDDPANKSLRDSIMQMVQTNDTDGLQEMEARLVPRVEAAIGSKVTREVPADIIKTYKESGGAPHLDGEYTVFGKVIKGLQVIDKIAAVPTDQSDRPIEDISVVVTVDEMTKSKIESKYGYQYPAK